MSDLSQSSGNPKTLGVEEGKMDAKIKKEDYDSLHAINGGLQEIKLEDEEQLHSPLGNDQSVFVTCPSAVSDLVVTPPPRKDQNETLVLYKCGSVKIKEGVRETIPDETYYITRTRIENIPSSVLRITLQYPENKEIYRWSLVPNSKHLFSALKAEIPGSTCGNLIFLPSHMNEQHLIDRITELHINKGI